MSRHEKSRRKWDSNPGSSVLEADALTTRPTRRLYSSEPVSACGILIECVKLWLVGWVNECAVGWVNQCVGDQLGQCMGGWMGESVCGRVSAWVDG